MEWCAYSMAFGEGVDVEEGEDFGGVVELEGWDLACGLNHAC